MSTPFLFAFAEALVDKLVHDELLVIADGSRDRVVLYLGNHLGTVGRGGTLISQIDAALMACAEVDDIFYDADVLKRVVEDLRG